MGAARRCGRGSATLQQGAVGGAVGRRTLAATCVVALLVVVACSHTSGSGSSGGGAGGGNAALPTDWAAIATALAKGADNLCARGDPRCIDAAVVEMRSIMDDELKTCDHLLPWTVIYLRVTESAARLARTSGTVSDPAWITRLAGNFAALWFKADEAWRAGRQADVTPSWRAVYQAVAAKQVNALGNLVMSMNAHISGDLPVALAAVKADAAHHDDFVRANQLFEQNFESGLSEVAQRFDPTAGTIVIPGIGETQAIVAAIAAWREEAFANAQRLQASTSDAERQSTLAAIGASASTRATTIQLGTSYPPFVPAAANRDAYCQQHGKG